jgi:hypothetical protein
MMCLGVCVGVATAICPLLLASLLLTFEVPLFRDLTRVRCSCFTCQAFALLEPLFTL